MLRGEETRGALVATACRTFAANGYHACTVDDIVIAAGVARGTFYLYFENKRAVLEPALDYAFDVVAAGTFVDPELIRLTGSGDLVEILAGMTKGLTAVTRSEPRLVRFCLFEALSVDAESRSAVVSFTSELAVRISGLLEIGQRRGVVRANLDVATAGVTIATLVLSPSIAALRSERGSQPRLDDIESFVDLISHVIAA